jgi:hypothetical protein
MPSRHACSFFLSERPPPRAPIHARSSRTPTPITSASPLPGPCSTWAISPRRRQPSASRLRRRMASERRRRTMHPTPRHPTARHRTPRSSAGGGALPPMPASTGAATPRAAGEAGGARRMAGFESRSIPADKRLSWLLRPVRTRQRRAIRIFGKFERRPRQEMPDPQDRLSSLKKSLPLSSTTMKAGKSSTSIFQIASMPSSGYSTISTFLMQSWARRAAGPPIEPR